MDASYRIDIDNNVLKFRTSSFKAERGSVLHSGIFSKELASSLAAGAALALIYLLFKPEPAFLNFILAIVIFMGLFILLRLFVFYDPLLEAVIDRASGSVTVVIKGLIGKKERYLLKDLEAVTLGRKVITPENPDGIRIVEKVALQHGMAIPGFGEVKSFSTVELQFRGGKRVMVFSSTEEPEAKEAHEKFKRFVEGTDA
ncbi:MAG: hypothetical protein Q8J64_04390 [Thermodesulfovibrionales bacterium]|nr:hypothetical protein [Thermodesulfovibrionales bacterium]